jgi:hypothetical protein
VTRKDLTARRERNADLGKRDQANRCGYCKKPLPEFGRIRPFPAHAADLIFCSEDCAADALIAAMGRGE